MATLIKSPRGTQDFGPSVTSKWQYVERMFIETSKLFGYHEIRTPTFEHTELFTRGIGDTTDVVQKEMYTFLDKKGRSITLKPEGTAGTMRSILENGMLNETMPIRLTYTTPCFRYEKAQEGRYREFHQFGVEVVGAQSPTADAEVIAVGAEIFHVLGIKDLNLEINSIGCPKCRPQFHKELKKYFAERKEELCDTCLDRLERNPLRILDCKCPSCQAIAKDAPVGLDFLCEECSEHFDGVKRRLDSMGLSYIIRPTIVRGLDYYTKTVFEFITTTEGAQYTICGGGRYDGLIEELGGPHTPGIGFAMGIERIIMVMDKCGCAFPPEKTCDVYFAVMGEASALKAARIVHLLRQEGFYAETDTMERSLKSQMKYADKIGAKYVIIIGDDELQTGIAKIKNMAEGTEETVNIDETIIDVMYRLIIEDAYLDISDASASVLDFNV